MAAAAHDVDAFLEDVDAVADAVANLLKATDTDAAACPSSDSGGVKTAMAKADRLIEALEDKHLRVTHDRTQINRATTPDSGPPPLSPAASASTTDAESFMREFSADADDRARRRAISEREGARLKEEGNAAFAQGAHNQANELYTLALRQWPDHLPLYTNRAQARLKLGMFQEALSDCDWALRLHERHPKALYRQGLALAGLQRFEEALASLTLALKASTGDTRKAVQATIEETQEARVAFERNQRAMQALSQEASEPLATWLRHLDTLAVQVAAFPDLQLRDLLSDGAPANLQALSHRAEQLMALFQRLEALRAHGDAMLSWLSTPRSDVDRELICGVFEKKQGLNHALLSPASHDLMEAQEHRLPSLATACIPALLPFLGLLATLTQHTSGIPLGRSMLSHTTLQRRLCSFVNPDMDARVRAATLKLLISLVDVDDACCQAVDFPALVPFLLRAECGLALMRLSANVGARGRLASPGVLSSLCTCLEALLRPREHDPSSAEAGEGRLVSSLLALLTNVGLDPAAKTILQQREHLLELLASYLKTADYREARTRAVGLLGRLMTDEESVSRVRKAHGLTRLCKLLVKSDVELVVEVSRAVAKAIMYSPQPNWCLSHLDSLLGALEMPNVTIGGNVALALSELVAKVPAVAERCVGTNLVSGLLVLARGADGGAKRNAANALARFAKASSALLEEIRALDGFAVLSTAAS